MSLVETLSKEVLGVTAGQAEKMEVELKRPRICMPSARNFTKRAFRCGLYEAQDVLLEVDDVDLICLEALSGFQLKSAWQRKCLYHDVSRRLMFMNPGLRKVRVTQEYDGVLPLRQRIPPRLARTRQQDHHARGIGAGAGLRPFAAAGLFPPRLGLDNIGLAIAVDIAKAHAVGKSLPAGIRRNRVPRPGLGGVG